MREKNGKWRMPSMGLKWRDYSVVSAYIQKN
jgi:hypothetical protein